MLTDYAGHIILGSLALVLLTQVLWRPLPSRSPWAVPVLVAILATLVDLQGALFAGGALRYAGLVFVAASVLLLPRGERGGAKAVRWVAGALAIYALVGTVIGRVAFDTASGALPLALPLLLLLLPWVHVDPRESPLVGLRWVAFLGGVYAYMTAAERVGYLPASALPVFNHEKAFLLVLALWAAVAARNVFLGVFTLGGVGWCFQTYPAATIALAFVVGVATVAVLRVRPRRGVRVATGGALLGLAWLAALRADELIESANSYFTAVGKSDNGETRADLYNAALERIQQAPIFGDFFTRDLALVTNVGFSGNRTLPVHNDYLTAGLGGGIVAAGLLVLITIVVNGVALAAYRAARRDRATVSSVLPVLLSAVNAAAVTAFANPIYLNPGSSTIVCALMFATVSVSLAVLRSTPNADEAVAYSSGTAVLQRS